MTLKPRLIMCNLFDEPLQNKDFALAHGFYGIDWSFDLETLPQTPLEESRWARQQLELAPFEVRYHCPFFRIDLGHDDPRQAKEAEQIFRRIIRMVSRAGGRFLSIHIGLGHDSTEPLSWETTISNLSRLVRFGANHRVTVCLENLAWGWTSKPNLFEKLIRLSGADVTFDIGHAQVCESVLSQQYTVEDFVSPHEGRVHNAHIYHEEIPGLGHMPPKRIDDIEKRLDLLARIGCGWWVIEIRDLEPLLYTKQLLDEYLSRSNNQVNTSEVL